jgi:hypothetical protein
MPCVCTECHEPCLCDEILCVRCLMDSLEKSNYEIGDNGGQVGNSHKPPADVTGK